MLKNILFVFVGFSLLSCSEEHESFHPYADFFFPYQPEAKFYVYRDVISGLNEKFYRVYSIQDSRGDHIVLEAYSMDGRITEAYNYNYDSLLIIDHMIVDRKGEQTKTTLLRNEMFPMKKGESTWFASKFPGFLDSTLILSELKRSFFKDAPIKTRVMGKAKNTIVFLDTIRLTQFNPFTKSEHSESIGVKSYYAEGIGLVRFHDTNLKTDYKLERILSQEEWVRMMQR